MPTDRLVLLNLTLVNSIIDQVTRSRRMRREDTEDFRQSVHLRLLERARHVFGQFEGRGSLHSYLHAVVRHMLLDWQDKTYGKWRPSVAAVRHGEVGVALDRLLSRDHVSLEEAIEQIVDRHPHARPVDLRSLAARLPTRRRRRPLPCEMSSLPISVAFDDPLERAFEQEEVKKRRLQLAKALVTLRHDQRRLVWLRYRRQLTVPTVARQIGMEPKPLYRQFDRILLALRLQLVVEGTPIRDGVDGRGMYGDRRERPEGAVR